MRHLVDFSSKLLNIDYNKILNKTPKIMPSIGNDSRKYKIATSGKTEASQTV
jgi:hypothetical protein